MGEMMRAEHLWKFITRGEMIVCPVNYGGIDIVLPVCVTKGKPFSRRSDRDSLFKSRPATLPVQIDNFYFDETHPRWCSPDNHRGQESKHDNSDNSESRK
jgi:hypothetical protein